MKGHFSNFECNMDMRLLTFVLLHIAFGRANFDVNSVMGKLETAGRSQASTTSYMGSLSSVKSLRPVSAPASTTRVAAAGAAVSHTQPNANAPPLGPHHLPLRGVMPLRGSLAPPRSATAAISSPFSNYGVIQSDAPPIARLFTGVTNAIGSLFNGIGTGIFGSSIGYVA